MQETNGKVLTPQENEEIVTDVTLGMDDCYSVEEVDHGAYVDLLSEEPTKASEPTDINKQFVDVMEDVAKQIAADETIQVAGTEEEVQEAVEKGKGLGQRMGEFLSKFPQTVKAFNEKPREKQFDYARSVIEGLYLQGKYLSATIPLTDEFMELDELEETGEAKEKTLVQIIKSIAVRVIAVTVGFVVETVFFTLDTALETVACLTRIGGHVVVEVVHSGKQIRDSFKRHYLK